MGGVRDVYNSQLMNSFEYDNINHIRIILKKMKSFEKLCGKGDQVACSIYIDLKTCLGKYGMEQTTLSKKQIEMIILNLVEGVPQEEVGEMMGMSQNAVSWQIKSGLNKMKVLLLGGGLDGESKE